MSNQSAISELAGVRCYRSPDDPTTFFFLPGEPAPERDLRGRPALTLWSSGASARLQLGARWEVPTEQLAGLKRELLRRHPELSPALIRLQPAPLGEVAAELALSDRAGAEPEPLARAASSGFTPYAALFNVELAGERQQGVMAALHGRTGFLKLRYRGELQGQATATVRLEGDVAEDLEALPDEPDAEACRAQVEAAVAAGRLTVSRAGDEGAPAELWERATEQATKRAADELGRMRGEVRRVLFGWGRPEHEAHLCAEASMSAAIKLPVSGETDVASWFPGASGATHVRPLGGDAQQRPPPAEGQSGAGSAGAVRLTFDPAKAPVAYVELRRGAQSGRLSGPTFEPVELPGAGTGPLEVTTHYTSGRPYTARLEAPGPDGWALAPADLGLAEVSVDATSRRDAGAREVRLRLRYRAAAAGADDDRTVYLRRDEWTARWFLITRAADLAGTLELDWREVGPTGATNWHPAEPIDTTTIVL